MVQTIEVIYEDNVLKPVNPIKGLTEHEKISIIIHPGKSKDRLRKIVGTLDKEEADRMQKLIDEEFGKIEGEW
ncbi:MAG: antitoxin family protein [Candidatus Eremiobacterota bacterium]